ncbi:MAG TPA: zinc-ribbon domain containing protein [Candidatus Saccharimonadales bacterium]|nr:zinc-ribbon domain containing protein [Candidatus Saccharimonadales bacterium]
MASVTQTCSKCGKQFLVIDQEQAFLKEKNLPLPAMCPSCRQMRRLSLRGADRALFKTKCQKCGKEIIVAFDPAKATNAIYCQKDWDQFFYDNDPIITDPLPED